MLFIFTLLLLLINANSLSYKPRVYNRIPKFYVQDRINNFIQRNRINNCYEHLENDHLLLLKCYKFNKLFDVEINIKPTYKKNNYISIYI